MADTSDEHIDSTQEVMSAFHFLCVGIGKTPEEQDDIMIYSIEKAKGEGPVLVATSDVNRQRYLLDLLGDAAIASGDDSQEKIKKQFDTGKINIFTPDSTIHYFGAPYYLTMYLDMCEIPLPYWTAVQQDAEERGDQKKALQAAAIIQKSCIEWTYKCLATILPSQITLKDGSVFTKTIVIKDRDYQEFIVPYLTGPPAPGVSR